MRRIRRCKGDRALLEGTHLIGEAIDAGLPLEYVLVDPDFLSSATGETIRERLEQFELHVVDPNLLEWVSDADSPRGVVAVVELPRMGVEALPARAAGSFLFIDGVQDPGNLGALVRSAEAFGVLGVALADSSVHPNHPRALRASAGSLLRMPVAIDVRVEDLRSHLRSLSPRWLALTPRDGQSLETIHRGGSYVIAVGAEGRGLSPEIERLADQRITLPIDSRVESLNATVAASILLFELGRTG